MLDVQARKLLLSLPDQIASFLDKWAANMERSGYLEHTTAKVEDCILSYQWFIHPLIEHVSTHESQTFPDLIHKPDWAVNILETARRHRSRGVTAEMFLGCFKTLVHSVEAIIAESTASPRSQHQAVRLIRLYADAWETLIVEDWSSVSEQESKASLDTANRLLTLEKNKYENIVSTISDLVLVTDHAGMVLEFNSAAMEHLGGTLDRKTMVWEALRLEGETMEDVARYYPMDQTHEISVREGTLFLNLKIIPLSAVSLASRGYIFVLNDITPYVNQRSILEQNVAERTEELLKEKAQVEGMVITLKNVLQTVEASRKEQMSSIAEDIESKLFPALRRIKAEKDPIIRRRYFDLFEDQLLQLAGQTGAKRDTRLLRLTSTEIKICHFIQADKSSKDIASALNISVGTVNTHRKNIRKKIGLQGKKNSLFTYLQATDNPSSLPSALE